MTYPERNILVKISNKLSAKMEEITSPLPLLCYALDSTIFSDEDYESVKDVDFLSEMQCDNAPGYFLGALLLFIRNFYEHSDNRNVWVCGLEQSTQHQRSKFISFIRKKCWARKNNCFPRYGSDNVREWVRSQSWVLKAEIGGETADILYNNTKLYNSLVNNFGAMPLMDKPENIDEWKLPQELEECQYVGYLFEHHKWTLMQSLYAIAAENDAPDNLPNWLKPLWGLKRNAIRETLKEKRQNAESSTPQKIKASWMMRYRRDNCEVVLKLRDCSSDRSIAQGSLSFSPRRDYVSVYDLIDRGFDMERPLLIKSGESVLEVCSLLKPVDEPGLVFMAPAGESDKSQYGGILTDCKKWRPRVCMLHRQNESPELLCGDQECKCIRKNTTWGPLKTQNKTRPDSMK